MTCDDCGGWDEKLDVKEYILDYPRGYIVKLCKRCFDEKYFDKASLLVKYSNDKQI